MVCRDTLRGQAARSRQMTYRKALNRPARAGDQCLADLLDGGQIRPRMVNWRDGPGRDCWRRELLIEAGQFCEVPPGHDSWVVSDEPWITIDWQPSTAYARTEGGGFDRVLATLLVTDIVDSTARALELGDARGATCWPGTTRR
jgi:hypothetical protein